MHLYKVGPVCSDGVETLLNRKAVFVCTKNSCGHSRSPHEVFGEANGPNTGYAAAESCPDHRIFISCHRLRLGERKRGLKSFSYSYSYAWNHPDAQSDSNSYTNANLGKPVYLRDPRV